jgi:tetratricopeptide (TPR) repeat protein
VDPLGEVQQEAESGLEFARKARFGLVVDTITGQLLLIRTLRGLTPDFSSFRDEEFDEDLFEQHLEADPGLAFAACWYWIRKLQARFYAEDYTAAIDAASKAQRLLWTSPAFCEVAEYHFYGALVQAAQDNAASADERQQHLDAHHQQLAVWAENCPENFGNRAALVGAEIARLEGKVLDAERLYEEAIRSAREHGFIQNEGLANELAARFYAMRGFETTAHAYLRNARYCYLRWGADGKVRQLDRSHPHLREELPMPSPRSTIGAPVEHLDLATVVKVSQAMSGEIVLEKLIDTLMVIALEHAGAERGLIVLPRADELRIEAEATTGRGRCVRHDRQRRLPATEVACAVRPESRCDARRTQGDHLSDDRSRRIPPRPECIGRDQGGPRASPARGQGSVIHWQCTRGADH